MFTIRHIQFSTRLWNAAVPLTFSRMVELMQCPHTGALCMPTVTCTPVAPEVSPEWRLFGTNSYHVPLLANPGFVTITNALKVLPSRKPVFVSLQGTLEDLRSMCAQLQGYSHVLVEWPIQHYNLEEVAVIVPELQKMCVRTPFGVKLGPMNRTQTAMTIHTLQRFGLDFVKSVGTLKGYAGSGLHAHAIVQLNRLYRLSTQGTVVIGAGGVTNALGVKRFRQGGAEAVEVGTAYLQHGVKIFTKLSGQPASPDHMTYEESEAQTTQCLLAEW